MTGGTEFQDAGVQPQKEQLEVNPEKQAEIKEAAEAKDQLDRASTNPEDVVEKTSDYKNAEAVQEAMMEAVNAVEAAPTARAEAQQAASGESSLPEKIESDIEEAVDSYADACGEAIDQAIRGIGSVTIEAAEAAADGRPMTEDREVEAAEMAADGRSMTEDREATIDSNDGISTEAIIDSNDGTSSISGEGFVSQLVDQLPHGADSFSNQASQNIVESVASGNPIVELDPIRESITGEFDNIPANQVEGLVAASLFKAADSMNSGGRDQPDNPPDSGAGTGTSPNVHPTDLSGGNDPGLVDLPGEDGVSGDPQVTQQEGSVSTRSVQDPSAQIVQDAISPSAPEDNQASLAGDSTFSKLIEIYQETIETTNQDQRYFLGRLADMTEVAQAMEDYLKGLNESEVEEEPESDSDWEGVATGDSCMPAYSDNNRELVNYLSDLKQELPKESVALADQISDKVWDLALPINKDTYIYELTKDIVENEAEGYSPLAKEEIVAVSLSNTIQSVRSMMSSIQENSEKFSLQEAKELWSTLLDFGSDTGADDEESFDTAFENFDQKAQQLFNILSTTLKTMKEMKESVTRNTT